MRHPRLLLIPSLLALLSGCTSVDDRKPAQASWVQQHPLYSNQSRAGLDSDPRDAMREQPLTKAEHVARGEEALRSDDPDRAVYEFLRALNLDEDDQTLYFRIGLVHGITGKLALADAAFRQALTLDPDYIPALEQRGRILLRQRQYDPARAAFEQAIRLDQRRRAGAGSAGKNQAEPETTEPETAEPATAVNGVDRQSPFHAYNGLGVLDDLRGTADSAQQYYQAALRIRPDSAITYNNLGYSHYLNNQHSRAAEYFSQATQLDPGLNEAWRNLALVYAQQERYRDAIDLLTRTFGDEAAAYNTVGYICLLNQRYPLAEDFFNRAISTSPVYYRLATENLEETRRRALQ